MAAQHGKLEQQGGVEHHVGVFLVGEYPLVFARAHAGPARDGLLCRVAAVVVVADDAAQQAVVGGGNPVVVVQRDGGQCRDVNLVLAFGGNLRGQFRVQGVDAFQDEDGVVVDAQLVAFEFLFAGVEVEARQFHFLAPQEGLQLGVEQLEVEGVERFVVVVALLVAGCVFAVHKVVVQRDGVGAQPVGHQLHAEALAEGGLSGGGGSGDEHELHAAAVLAPLVDVVGYLGYLLLLQGFRHVDEVGGMSFLASQVEVAGVAQPHDVVPAQVFLEDVEHLLLLHHLFQRVGVLLAGDAQQQPVVVFHEVEQPDEAGAGQQVAVVIVHGVAQRIIIGVERAGGFQQPHLVVHAALAEDAHGFGGVALRAVKGDVLGDDFLHPLLDGGDVFQRDGPAEAQVAEVALRYGMFHVQLSCRKQLADSLVEDETERADVGAHARGVAYVEKLHVLVVVDAEVQPFGTVVDLGADHLIGEIEIKTVINIQKCASDRECFINIIIFATNLYRVFHNSLVFFELIR